MNLPSAWSVESLAAIAVGGVFSDGDWVETKDQDPEGSVRLTQLADVGVGEFRNRSDRWMREDQASRLNCTFLAAGDILIARMPEPIGRACIAPQGLGKAVTAVDVAILRLARRDVDRRYVMWAMNSPEARDQVIAKQSGTTRKRISRTNLSTIEIPLPPLDEQRRIVAILEEHLSGLESSEAGLQSALRRVSALRALLLDQLAPPSVPRKALSAISIRAGYGSSAKCVPHGAGLPVVRIPNLVNGRVDLSDEKRCQDRDVDLSSFLLEEGDLLVVRTNGSKDLIGRAAVVQPGVSAAFASYLIRVRVDRTMVAPDWARLMLERPSARVAIEAAAASSAGQYNLSLGKLNPMEVPLPPLDTQRKLVAVYKARDADLCRLSASASAGIARTHALRRAVLETAFSGRLTGRSSDEKVIEELAEETA